VRKLDLLVSTKKKNTKNYGALLFDFLEIYGKKFDYQNMGISICNGGNHFLLKEAQFRYPPAALVIVDPLNPSQNIAHHVYGIYRVKLAFEDAHNILTSLLVQHQQQQSNNTSDQSSILDELFSKESLSSENSKINDILNATNSHTHSDHHNGNFSSSSAPSSSKMPSMRNHQPHNHSSSVYSTHPSINIPPFTQHCTLIK